MTGARKAAGPPRPDAFDKIADGLRELFALSCAPLSHVARATEPPRDTSGRIAQIHAMAPDMQDWALVDWKTVAGLIGSKDIENTRDLIKAAGVPLVQVSARRALPRWGEIKKFMLSRER